MRARRKLHLTPLFWQGALSGALSQVLATAALLVSMRRAGFAVGVSVQQSSLPLAAILGLLLFHDPLRPLAWTGVAITSAALAVLTWPRRRADQSPSAARPSAFCPAWPSATP